MNFGHLTHLDVHDLKSAFNKVKAAVLNLTELEQKVKEATNSDAWGASSSLMQEIAQGFNEVMPSIYKRFSQEGRTWRNIYK
ncbi:Epsin-3, clathrin recruitment and traffic between the Golgi and endosome, partial [Coelomomyces lativittatus]